MEDWEGIYNAPEQILGAELNDDLMMMLATQQVVSTTVNKFKLMFMPKITPEYHLDLVGLMNVAMLKSDGSLMFIKTIDVIESTERYGWFWQKSRKVYLLKAMLVDVVQLGDTKHWYYMDKPNRLVTIDWKAARKKFVDTRAMFNQIHWDIADMHQEHNDIY